LGLKIYFTCSISKRKSQQVGTPTAATAHTAEHHPFIPNLNMGVLGKELGPLGYGFRMGKIHVLKEFFLARFE
jgi:hypothetical protein